MTDFTPTWAGPIEGRAVNLIKGFYPRLAAHHEFDDLMQDAYIVFMKCEKRYTGTVDNAGWFMSLFQRSLTNFLINLASARMYISIDDAGHFEEPTATDATGYEAVIMAELPGRIKTLASVLCSGTEAEGRRAYRSLQRLLPGLT